MNLQTHRSRLAEKYFSPHDSVVSTERLRLSNRWKPIRGRRGAHRVGFELVFVAVVFGWFAPVYALSVDLAVPFQQTIGGSDFFGSDGNPEAGLRLSASGAVNYNYSLPADVAIGVPGIVFPGQVLNLQPIVQITGAPSLTTTGNTTFETELVFNFDKKSRFAPDIHIHLSPSLHNINVGGASLVFEGDRSLASSVSSFSSNALTTSAEADAWSAGVDLLGLFDIPALDLDLSVGLDLIRKDAVGVGNFGFTEASLVVPETWSVGTPFPISRVLQYDLTFASHYYLQGSLDLVFDAPFISPQNIFDHDFGDDSFLPGGNTVTQTKSLSVGTELQVVSRDEWCDMLPVHLQVLRGCAVGIQEILNPHGKINEFVGGPLTLNRVFMDVPVDVPEPSTFCLFAVGLLTFAGTFWRRHV